MQVKRLGRQTTLFCDPVGVVSWASVVGRMEGSGPLGGSFDLVNEDSFYNKLFIVNNQNLSRHNAPPKLFIDSFTL